MRKRFWNILNISSLALATMACSQSTIKITTTSQIKTFGKILISKEDNEYKIINPTEYLTTEINKWNQYLDQKIIKYGKANIKITFISVTTSNLLYDMEIKVHAVINLSGLKLEIKEKRQVFDERYMCEKSGEIN